MAATTNNDGETCLRMEARRGQRSRQVEPIETGFEGCFIGQPNGQRAAGMQP